MVPADWANSVTALVYDVFNQAATVFDARAALGFGNLALQNSTAISVTGGAIDGVPIGLNGPALGRFTTVSLTNITPVLPEQAASKQYVDTTISNAFANIVAQALASGLLAGKVNKSGDTMTGPLVLSELPTTLMEAAPKQYVDAAVTTAETYTDTSITALKAFYAQNSGASQIGYTNGLTVAAQLGNVSTQVAAATASLAIIQPIVTGNQSANTVFAGPASGSATAPGFRALALTDLPLVAQANGLATLDSTGHLTLAQLPPSVVGGMVYQGVWNASTNTPNLTSGVGTKGWLYKVSVAGGTSLDGTSLWNVGDSVVFDGTTWDKIDGGQNEVISVAGRVGVVTLTYADIGGLANVASSGSFTDLINVPTASAGTLGLIKVGSGLTITAGVLSANAQPLVPATNASLGGVIVGTGLTVDGTGLLSISSSFGVSSVSGQTGAVVVSATGSGTASSVALVNDPGNTTGTIKLKDLVQGTGITLTGATTSVTVAASLATSGAVGVVKPGTGLAVDGTGTLALQAASAGVLGGVQPGAGIAIAPDGTISTTGGGTGTVTSVALVMPSIFSVSGSPVTASGTLTASLAAQNPSLFFAGPVSGGATAPTFRAIVQNDLPLATTSTAGIIQVSNGLSVSAGALSANVRTVSGQIGAVVIQAANNNAATGTSLITDNGSTTGTIKFKTIVQGTNITLSTDANGNMVIASSGGGSSTLATLTDVALGTLSNGDLLTYSTASSKWVNSQPAITTVAGRTGAIVLAVADVSGAAPLASPTFTGTVTLPAVTGGGNITLGGNQIINSVLKQYGETTQALGTVSSGTATVNLTNGNAASLTVGGNITLAITNPAASGIESGFVLYLTNGGAFTINWPAGTKWPGGAAPALTASGVDIITFTTINNGTTWYALPAGLGMA
jgi:hypothetical protein